jgi:hypothetical protein
LTKADHRSGFPSRTVWNRTFALVEKHSQDTENFFLGERVYRSKRGRLDSIAFATSGLRKLEQRRQIFRGLVGDADDSGIGGGWLPSFTATVQLDAGEARMQFRWGVVLDGPQLMWKTALALSRPEQTRMGSRLDI